VRRTCSFPAVGTAAHWSTGAGMAYSQLEV